MTDSRWIGNSLIGGSDSLESSKKSITRALSRDSLES